MTNLKSKDYTGSIFDKQDYLTLCNKNSSNNNGNNNNSNDINNR